MLLFNLLRVFLFLVTAFGLTGCFDSEPSKIQIRFQLNAPLPDLRSFVGFTPVSRSAAPSNASGFTCYMLNVTGEAIENTLDPDKPYDNGATPSCLGLGTISQLVSLSTLTTSGLSLEIVAGEDRTVQFLGIQGNSTTETNSVCLSNSEFDDTFDSGVPQLYSIASQGGLSLNSDGQVVNLVSSYQSSSAIDLVAACATSSIELADISDQSVIIGSTVSVDVNDSTTGTDTSSAGNELSYSCYQTNDQDEEEMASCSELEGTFSFDTETGVFSWTPEGDAAVGGLTTTYEITIYANDGVYSSSAYFQIVVTPSGTLSLSIDGETQDNGSSYSFGIYPPTFVGDSKDFTITNTSNEALSIDSISIDNSDDFTLTSSVSSIAAGSSATFNVTFNPAAASSVELTTTLTMTGTTANIPDFSLTLSGVTKWLGDFIDGSPPTAVGINHTSAVGANDPKLEVFNDELYAIWIENSVVRIKKYDSISGAWTSVEGSGGAPAVGATVNLEIYNQKLHATWEHSGTIRVWQYDGTDWSYVDSGGFGATSFYQPHVQTFEDKLFLAYKYGPGQDIQVKSYDGSIWVDLDTSGIVTTSPSSPELAVFNGALYVIFTDNNGTAVARIYRYDGSTSWSEADSGTPLSSDPTTSPHLITFNHKLYAIWSEGGQGFIHIKVFDGNSWSSGSVDPNPAGHGLNYDAARSASSPHLAVFKNKLYATWSEDYLGTGITLIRLAVYNGDETSPSWANVEPNNSTGLNWVSTENAITPFLTVYSDQLVAAWEEANGAFGQIRVRQALP